MSHDSRYISNIDRLLSLYHRLHASIHAKGSHLTVQLCSNQESMSLAWVTQVFEIYCVAAPTTARNALAQSANKVVQWIRREEERVFIIGGAVRIVRSFLFALADTHIGLLNTHNTLLMTY